MGASPLSGSPTPERPESVWASLNYFNLYRLIVASLFMLAIVVYPRSSGLGTQHLGLFVWTGLAYWLSALFLFAAFRKLDLSINVQLGVGVTVDVLALTLMIHASGGKTGLAVMLLVVLAGAGLVSQGRLTLFFAAMATVAVLLEQGLRVLALAADPADFLQTGILCIGFFATAVSARLLARRVIANEELARQRGVDLAKQLSVSERVIRDMHDGVLVVDAEERVRQFNPQAAALLEVRPPAQPDLAVFSVALAEGFRGLGEGTGEEVLTVQVPGTSRLLRARYVRMGEGGGALIYLEDLGRIQAQARQLKLAALGRLTANIAHEIRNPLSAISHAAELLREEKRADKQERLSRIINDNAQRLEGLVKDVLELGRRDRAEPEPIRLARFLDNLVEEFPLRGVGSRKCFALEADREVVLVFDRTHLNQVLWNLLANACRHCSQREGAVRVLARPGASAGSAELHIIDDGAGVPEEAQGKIFEPFFTTHSKGTGLGLYIARELCEANGAVLEWVGNGPGAHFRIAGRSE
jgi:two-component system sensor histidine kinase PilS (NtrC family)